MTSYEKKYAYSIEHNAKFWAEQAQNMIDWFEPWTEVVQGDFTHLPIRWFVKGKLNAAYNCIDRHLALNAQKPAIIFEGNEEGQTETITYQKLYEEVCLMAEVFRQQGVTKGDRVCIYLPMIPEAIYAMLACARIGAIHNVVFGGFSSEALKNRIQDSMAKLVITVDEAKRGDKRITFKENLDEALNDCSCVESVLVINYSKSKINLTKTRDLDYRFVAATVEPTHDIEWMDSQDPLFMLYTSGSTGKPKGIVHGTGGYLVYAATTYRNVFDHQPDNIHWCTADVGWITGHSYLVYGPLSQGATIFMYEGVPNYPDYGRYWRMIERHKITHFYTAPTVLRSLRLQGDEWITPYKLDSLRLLGSVGEPINPDVWLWFSHVIGHDNLPIVNTWWQTETGGVLISPLPHDEKFIPGASGHPFFGVVPYITAEGLLYIQQPWPGLMQTIFNDEKRFVDLYLSQPEWGYFTGDGAYQDEEGFYHITGRVDDVIKLSGHRLGSEELESALVSHEAVCESAVIGVPHEIKGESIVAFVVVFNDVERHETLKNTLKHHLREKIGPVATPDEIIWVNELPKTRSGKIMRRLLKKIAVGEFNALGDISTLSNPHVVEELIDVFKKIAKDTRII